jgi:hypothetical protein
MPANTELLATLESCYRDDDIDVITATREVWLLVNTLPVMLPAEAPLIQQEDRHMARLNYTRAIRQSMGAQDSHLLEDIDAASAVKDKIQGNAVDFIEKEAERRGIAYLVTQELGGRKPTGIEHRFDVALFKTQNAEMIKYNRATDADEIARVAATDISYVVDAQLRIEEHRMGQVRDEVAMGYHWEAET